jgi:hypothetical protein
MWEYFGQLSVLKITVMHAYVLRETLPYKLCQLLSKLRITALDTESTANVALDDKQENEQDIQESD